MIVIVSSCLVLSSLVLSCLVLSCLVLSCLLVGKLNLTLTMTMSLTLAMLFPCCVRFVDLKDPFCLTSKKRLVFDVLFPIEPLFFMS
jgi:hypothetical protein